MYDAGLAKSTSVTKRGHIKAYLQHILKVGGNPLKPSFSHTLHFARILFEEGRAPTAVRNRLSSAKTWVEEMGGRTAAFTSRVLAQTVKGGQRMSKHVTRRAPPITPEMIKLICAYLDKAGPVGLAPKAAILIGYFGMLRRSNICSPAVAKGAGPHTIRRGDIVRTHDGLHVTIVSAKTIRLPSQSQTLFIPAVNNKACCPRRAWKKHIAVNRASDEVAAFSGIDGRPLTPRALTAIIQHTVREAGVPDYKAYTTHGLRRGSAQACEAAGVTKEDIMRQGIWSSKAVNIYLAGPVTSGAPIALSGLFG